jgi:hypothetical protein
MCHKGVAIWHTYKDDDINQGQRTYWYTLDPLCGEGVCSGTYCPWARCVMVFDIRTLPNWPKDEQEPDHRVIMKEAINKGWLTIAGLNLDDKQAHDNTQSRQ